MFEENTKRKKIKTFLKFSKNLFNLKRGTVLIILSVLRKSTTKVHDMVEFLKQIHRHWIKRWKLVFKFGW
jgi:hypothetical protein